jgi:predicted ATPase
METPLIQAFSPFALQVRRATAAVIGRPIELAAIQQELATAQTARLAALTVEGEPGIGKTRLLLAASELASAQGFTTIAVAADQEIRGPFLLARSIMASPEAASAADGTSAAQALQRSLDALSGRDDPGLDSLPLDQKFLRTLDLAALAFRTLASQRPVALLLDDLQWADDDSLRLIRYIVRADAASPIFLMASIRPEELAFVTEAVNLVADMERLGIVRRLKVSRFTQLETAEFLRQLLGGKVDAPGAAAMHAQAEGVPFIVEELAHAYRGAGMIQEIDGTWTLAKNAEHLVPSAVRTLISRRAARVPEETKAVLAEAAVLGRHFSLKDIQALRIQLGDRKRRPAPWTKPWPPQSPPACWCSTGRTRPPTTASPTTRSASLPPPRSRPLAGGPSTPPLWTCCWSASRPRRVSRFWPTTRGRPATPWCASGSRSRRRGEPSPRTRPRRSFA